MVDCLVVQVDQQHMTQQHIVVTCQGTNKNVVGTEHVSIREREREKDWIHPTSVP